MYTVQYGLNGMQAVQLGSGGVTLAAAQHNAIAAHNLHNPCEKVTSWRELVAHYEQTEYMVLVVLL